MPNFTRVVQNTPPAVAQATLKAHQQLVEGLGISGGALMHWARVDSTFASDKRNVGSVDQSIDFTPVGLDSAACIARTNAIKRVLVLHLADGTYAHSTADTVSAPITAADATDDATCSTLLVELTTTINTHLGLAGVHRGLPQVVAQVTTVAVDLATNIQCINEILALYKRHFYAAAEQLVLGAS